MALPDSLKFEGRDLLFRNFAGKEGQYNSEGDRNFCLKLTEQEALLMIEDGWNVKYRKQQDPDDEPQPYLPITVSTKFKPSRIVLITARRDGSLGRTTLTEDMFMFVDWVDVAWADLIIRPFAWSMRGNSGVKAYLQTIYVRVKDDELDMKYADVPEVDMGGQQLELEAADPTVIEYDGPVDERDVMELER
jgi:hypothetical protein